jgi:predicted nuclease with TOPRIM domain
MVYNRNRKKVFQIKNYYFKEDFIMKTNYEIMKELVMDQDLEKLRKRVEELEDDIEEDEQEIIDRIREETKNAKCINGRWTLGFKVKKE